jgi:hypothetical protein
MDVKRPSAMVMTPLGQAVVHRTQPLHLLSSITMRPLAMIDLLIILDSAYLVGGEMASEKHPFRQ